MAPELERVVLDMRTRAARDLPSGTAMHLTGNVVSWVLLDADMNGTDPRAVDIEVHLAARITQDRTIRAGMASYPHDYPADTSALVRDLAAIWRGTR